MRKRALLLMLPVMLVSGCASMSGDAPARVDLTGVWRMDREMSGNPSTLPGIAGVAGKAGASADPPGDSGPALLHELGSQRLRIDQSHGTTLITYDGGQTQTYDWRRFVRGAEAAGWKGTHFIVRRTGPGGKVLERRYILTDDGLSLTVVTVFNKAALSQLYELDKAATRKAFGKELVKTAEN